MVDSVVGTGSDDGGTSVEGGTSLAGMTLDEGLGGLADSEASGSAELEPDILVILGRACSSVLATSEAGALVVLVSISSSGSAELEAGALAALAGAGSILLSESEDGILAVLVGGCSAAPAVSPESPSDSAYC